MYCANCGKQIEAKAWRCDSCRGLTAAFKRNSASVLILAISGFALYWTDQVLIIWLNFLVSYGREAHLWTRAAVLFASETMKFGPWIIALYVVAAILLRKKTAALASGRLAIWAAGLFALLTLAATLAGGIEGVITGTDGWSLAREKNYELSHLYARDAMREVAAAETGYQAIHKREYACDLTALPLGTLQKRAAEHGYELFLACGPGPATGYRLFARPVPEDVPGGVTYCTDERGPLESLPSYYVGSGTVTQEADTCLKKGQPVKE